MQSFTVTPQLRNELIARRGRVHAFETVAPSKTALLVVDMQNYFMEEGQPACCPAARDIVPNINRLAAYLRDCGGLVVWIATEAKPETPDDWANFYESYLPEAKAKRQINLAQNGSGFPLWPDLAVDPADTHVIKTRYSAFIQGSSDIEPILRARGIDTLLVTGTVTNVCCESTARDAMMLGFRTIMVSDGNAAMSQENHELTLRNFLVTFGDVQSTDEAIANIAKSADNRAAAE
jgi:ureidoacrylate peracid hydrolase